MCDHFVTHFQRFILLGHGVDLFVIEQENFLLILSMVSYLNPFFFY